MMKNDILQSGEKLIRVLALSESKAFVIDCKKQTMPYWTEKESLSEFKSISEAELQEILGCRFPDADELCGDEKRQIRETYSIIASVVPFADDETERKEMIKRASEKHGITAQTVRKYLCKYLVFQDMMCFLRRKSKRAMTDDEKNFRYILNKYFYSTDRRSLHTCYIYLLRERYSDEKGKLLSEYPPFHRFRYYYYKTKRTDNFLISRYGRYKYDRDFKPLLGNSQNYFGNVGFGEVDSTIADIWLSDENHNLVGRPIITAMVCPFSQLLLGYTIGFEGGATSLSDLMRNVNCNKVDFCKSLGIEIDKNVWANSGIPMTIITDRGKEYLSENYSQLTDLGVEIINLRQFTPNEKGMVEQFFNIIQNYYKQYLMNSGVIREDFNLRGAPDYRKQATLTLSEFNKILLMCIIHYNSKRVIRNIPYSYIGKAKPFACDLFLQSYSENPDCFIEVSDEKLRKILLPRTRGTFRRNGLFACGLRYRAPNFTERYLRGGSAVVAYNPYNIGEVYLLENGEYTRFELIDSFFEGKTSDEAEKLCKDRNKAIKACTEESLQSEMDLGACIDDIIFGKQRVADTKNVRQNRAAEIAKEHIRKGASK